jgi:hypothetical protein
MSLGDEKKKAAAPAPKPAEKKVEKKAALVPAATGSFTLCHACFALLDHIAY